MTGDEIEPLTEAAFPAVLAVNNSNAAETSLLDMDGLAKLIAQSCFACGIGQGRDAFLIAMNQDAAYESPNFDWFRDRHASFVYIDRIITAAHARGRGLARRLYGELFDAARRMDLHLVTCEVNVQPPNPVSHAFHAALGFEPIGEAKVYGGTRTVRYYEKRLPPRDR